MSRKNNLDKHICSDKAKWILSAVAFVLLGIFVAAACTQGFTNGDPWGWFGKKEDEKNGSAAGGMELGESDSAGKLSLTSTVIPIANYADYGISPASEAAVTVKASFKDYAGDPLSEEDAAKVKLVWTTDWKSKDGWASGKSCSDYVTVSPQEDTHSVTVSCSQAFGAQIELKAAVEGDEDVSGSIPIDYCQKYDHIEVQFEWGTATGHVSKSFNSKTDVLGGVFIDFPLRSGSDALAVGWDSDGKIEVKIVGASVYTKPIVGSVTKITVTSNIKSKIQAAGGSAVGDDAIMAASGSTPGYQYKVAQMLGVSDYSGMSVSAFRSAVAKNYMAEAIVKYTFHLYVNGAELSEKPTCSVFFNTSSLSVSASSIELDSKGLEF